MDTDPLDWCKGFQEVEKLLREVDDVTTPPESPIPHAEQLHQTSCLAPLPLCGSSVDEQRYEFTLEKITYEALQRMHAEATRAGLTQRCMDLIDAIRPLLHRSDTNLEIFPRLHHADYHDHVVSNIVQPITPTEPLESACSRDICL